MNDNLTATPPKTLAEFCGLDDSALASYLEQKGAFLQKLDEKADARIQEALEKKLSWVA